MFREEWAIGLDRAVVLFGTVTGTAEDLSDELVEALGEAGMEATAVDMMDARANFFDEHRAVVVCVATHGDGELPPDAMDFYEALEEERPDLGGVVFGVCALGDDAYEDFCEAGRTMSRFFTELGAKEAIERHEIDGFVDDEVTEKARQWTLRAAEAFKKEAEHDDEEAGHASRPSGRPFG